MHQPFHFDPNYWEEIVLSNNGSGQSPGQQSASELDPEKLQKLKRMARILCSVDEANRAITPDVLGDMAKGGAKLFAWYRHPGSIPSMALAMVLTPDDGPDDDHPHRPHFVAEFFGCNERIVDPRVFGRTVKTPQKKHISMIESCTRCVLAKWKALREITIPQASTTRIRIIAPKRVRSQTLAGMLDHMRYRAALGNEHPYYDPNNPVRFDRQLSLGTRELWDLIVGAKPSNP